MTNNKQSQVSMQTLKADLFLLHAPSVYDFRERDDLLFAYLSDSHLQPENTRLFQRSDYPNLTPIWRAVVR